MKSITRDYTDMTAMAQRLGFEPYMSQPGAYKIHSSSLIIDLSSCEETETAILNKALATYINAYEATQSKF